MQNVFWENNAEGLCYFAAALHALDLSKHLCADRWREWHDALCDCLGLHALSLQLADRVQRAHPVSDLLETFSNNLFVNPVHETPLVSL